MVHRCPVCKERARRDRSCRHPPCSQFRPNTNGHHWKKLRLSQALGVMSQQVGAFVVGGFALWLRHRHDIRVGIASGMHLRRFVSDAPTRMVLLAGISLCYWRWATKSLLLRMRERMGDLASAASGARDALCANMLQEAWSAMEEDMSDFQVVSFPDQRRVELMRRKSARKLSRSGMTHFAYHPFSNPASRRTGAQEFGMLIADIRSGSLWRAFADLAKLWRTGASTFSQGEATLARHNMNLWSGRGHHYGRARWRAQGK